MQFLVIARRNSDRFTEADFTPRLEAEAEEARTLYAVGFLRQIWNRSDMAGACMLIEAADMEAARAGLQRLPLVAAGMLDIGELIPLRPYRGFGPRG